MGVPLGEPQKDAGDEDVDVVVDPRVRTLVVVDHSITSDRCNR